MMSKGSVSLFASDFPIRIEHDDVGMLISIYDRKVSQQCEIEALGPSRAVVFCQQAASAI